MVVRAKVPYFFMSPPNFVFAHFLEKIELVSKNAVFSQFIIHTVHELFSSYRSYELEVIVVWTHEYESANRMNFMNLELKRPWTHEYELRKSWTVWIWNLKKLISSYELYELQTEDQSLEQISLCREVGGSDLYLKRIIFYWCKKVT